MFQENVPLSAFSNYRIGGPARYFFVARNIGELKAALEEAKRKNLEVFILGGGTNLLIDDEGFHGLVLKPEFVAFTRDGEHVRAGAGVLMENLLLCAEKEELSGLEWAGGLPGTVGGAIRGNAGAFGGEIEDAVESVESFDVRTFRKRTRSARECEFGYRTSVFKKKGGEEIITAATFKLRPGDKKEIARKMKERVRYRETFHPMEYPNIGSTFKNVPLEEVPEAHRAALAHVVKTDPFPIVPAAYLISEAGLKGTRSGGAVISPKHPNFIVNTGGATAKDVQELIALAKKEVRKRFEIELEEEIQFVSPDG